MRLAIHPLIGRMMAFDTRYDVSTQVLSSWLTERFPAMCGSDTLAMLVSSTSMKVAIVTTRAMAHGLWPPVHPVAKYAGRASSVIGPRGGPSARPTSPDEGARCPAAPARCGRAPECA